MPSQRNLPKISILGEEFSIRPVKPSLRCGRLRGRRLCHTSICLMQSFVAQRSSKQYPQTIQSVALTVSAGTNSLTYVGKQAELTKPLLVIRNVPRTNSAKMEASQYRQVLWTGRSASRGSQVFVFLDSSRSSTRATRGLSLTSISKTRFLWWRCNCGN